MVALWRSQYKVLSRKDTMRRLRNEDEVWVDNAVELNKLTINYYEKLFRSEETERG